MSSPSEDDDFPLGRKALGYHLAAMRKAGISTKDLQDLRQMLEDLIDIVDMYVDDTEAKKDDLVAATILSMIPPPERPDAEKMTAQYNEKVATLASNIDRIGSGVTLDKDTARAHVVITTAVFSHLADTMTESPHRFADPRIAAEIREAYRKAYSALKSADAPGLREVLEDTYSGVTVAFESIAPAHGDEGFDDDDDDDDDVDGVGLEALDRTEPLPRAATGKPAARVKSMDAPPSASSAVPLHPDVEKALRDFLGDEGFEIIDEDFLADELGLFPAGGGNPGAPAVNTDELRTEADKILKASPGFNDAAADKVLVAFDADILKKYPDVKPALQDLNRMFGLWTGEAVPEKEIRSAAEAIKIVDAVIDGDDEAKCDAAIATILMRLPPHFSSSGVDTSIARDYGPNVENYIRDIAAINMGAEPSARIQPMVFANLIADVEGSVADIAAGKANEGDIEGMREGAFAFSEKMSKMKIAPAARALSERLEESFVKLLDAADDHDAKLAAEKAAKAASKGRSPRP